MDFSFSDPTSSSSSATNEHKLLRYILGKAGVSQRQHAYRRAGVQPQRFAAYQAFVQALIATVYDTYLGQDCIYREADITAHFGWCYDKTSQDQQGLGFHFERNAQLRDYFQEYFRLNLYLCESQRETDLAYFHSFFHLDLARPVPHADLDTCLDLYQVFELTPRRGRNLVSAR